MTPDWLRLEPDEAVHWETHPRLLRAAPGILAGLAVAVAAVAAGVALDPRALAGLLVAPLPAAYASLRVVTTRYVVTDRALYRKRGILGIDLRSIEQTRVQNTRTIQGVFGTAFGHGTVEVEVAGGPDLRFADVQDPNDVRRRIERLGGGRRSVPGSVDQWRAVLAELRAIRRALEAQSRAAS
jgi:uncharacterized membrane protein YdbT with pleckstrin-like domain